MPSSNTDEIMAFFSSWTFASSGKRDDSADRADGVDSPDGRSFSKAGEGAIRDG